MLRKAVLGGSVRVLLAPVCVWVLLVAGVPCAQGYEGTLDLTGAALSNKPAVLIASDPSRDTLAVTAEFRYHDLGILAGSERFRIIYELVDPKGLPVGLADGTGGSVDSVVHSLGSHAFVEGIGEDSEPVTDTLVFRPSAAVSPTTTYRVKVTAQRLETMVWKTVDTLASVGREILYFPSTDSDDASYNLVGWVEPLSFTQTYAIDTATYTANHQHLFKASIPFHLYRYDHFEAVFPGSLDLVIEFSLALFDKSGNEIPLDDPDPITLTRSIPEFVSGVGKAPYHLQETLAVEFSPAQQLQSISQNYRLVATMRYREGSGLASAVAVKSGSTPTTRLLHFSGILQFGTGVPCRTELAFLVDGFTVQADQPDPNALDLVLHGMSGGLSSDRTFYYSATEGDWKARLDDSGALLFTDDRFSIKMGTLAQTAVDRQVGPLTMSLADSDDMLGMPIKLTTSGASAFVTVRLPAGMGWREDPDLPLAHGMVPFGTVRLNSSLQPALALLTWAPEEGECWVMEETKPIWIRTSQLRWWTGSGRFELVPAECRYARAAELEALEDAANWLVPPPAEVVRKPSNEQIYRYAAAVLSSDSTGSSVVPAIETDADGAARLTAEFALAGSGSFYAHFPNKARISWPTGMPNGNGGFLRIEDGQVMPGESRILSPQATVVQYGTACGEGCEEAADDPESQRYMALSPTCPAYFTEDGGLWFSGEVVERVADNWYHEFWTEQDTVRTLEWGRRPDQTGLLEFAHRTLDFSLGSFHMPGSNWDAPGDDVAFPQQPAALLYTAVNNPGDTAEVFRPNSLGDQRGLGDYAGINLRVSEQPVVDGLSARQGGISCLGDASSAGTAAVPVWYPVQDYSHYYVRSSGISGIHAAADFPDALVVYGYAMTFDQFGLSFLSNSNQASVTRGSVVLPYPADFSQEFDNLKVSCLGDLLDAQVPESAGEKTLSYWQTNMTPLTFEFRSESGPCTTGTGSLCLGVRTGEELFSEPLFGTLAFLPDGTLISPAIARAEGSIPDDIGSRLTAPNVLRVRGPRSVDGIFEQYYVQPASYAYFNDYRKAEADSSPQSNGFLAIAGHMDVPFFEDMPVQLHTRGTDSATAPLFVAGGWDDDGQTLFSDLGFDPDNAGYPASVPGSLADYRAGGSNGGTGYLPHARYDWLGLVPFDFPLAWNQALRTFESPSPIGMDVVVLETEAEVKYLSAEQAEITFGTRFPGLPQINLAECAFSQVDEVTGAVSGAVQSIVKAASDEIADSLNAGTAASRLLTTDRVGELLEDALDRQADALVEVLYARVAAEWDTATGRWSSSEALRTALESQHEALVDAVRHAVLADTGTRGDRDALDLVAQLRSQLLAVQNGIRAVVGADLDVNGVTIVNPIQPPVEPGIAPVDSHGLLSTTVHPGGLADYRVLPGLIYALIEDLAPSLADSLSVLLAGPMDELNSRANAVLAEGQPALERVRGELLRLESEVALLRHSLESPLPTHEFRDQLESLLAAADARGELDAFAELVTDRIQERLAPMVSTAQSMRVAFPQVDEEEIKAQFRRAIHDAFGEIDLAHALTVSIRQRFFDLDGMINGAYDALFAQLNEAIKGVAAEALPDLNVDLGEFLGPFGNAVKGGGLEGYARINGDALRLLRLDLDVELNVPDPMALHAYLEIRQSDSVGDDSGCTGSDDEPRTEIVLGADRVPVHWLDSDIELSLMTKFIFLDGNVAGFGGGLEMTDGELGFEDFVISDFGAAVAFGAGEAYLAARAAMDFQDYHVGGALFFGRTCSLAPLEMVDPDVASVLGDPPFTGAYVYGECGMPIYGNTCAFRIEALVGAGVFFFVEGPTFGGKLLAEVSGEALCAVHVGGGLTLIGLKDADGFVYRGDGRVSGSVGPCPFCLKFRKKVRAVNRHNSWSVSY